MSCNIRIPLQQIIDDVAAALSDGFIKTDNAVLTEAVLNEVTIRGDISVDTAARNALCAILQTCGITAVELEWLDRPTVADMVAVSSLVGGEIVVTWQDLDALIAAGIVGKVSASDVSVAGGGSQEDKNTEFRNELDALPFENGVLADTFVIATANGVGTVARTQRDVNADTVHIKDFGAKCDGITDDTIAFQTAILYAQDTLSELHLKGRILVTNQLELTSKLWLKGNGAEIIFDNAEVDSLGNAEKGLFSFNGALKMSGSRLESFKTTFVQQVPKNQHVFIFNKSYIVDLDIYDITVFDATGCIMWMIGNGDIYNPAFHNPHWDSIRGYNVGGLIGQASSSRMWSAGGYLSRFNIENSINSTSPQPVMAQMTGFRLAELNNWILEGAGHPLTKGGILIDGNRNTINNLYIEVVSNNLEFSFHSKQAITVNKMFANGTDKVILSGGHSKLHAIDITNISTDIVLSNGATVEIDAPYSHDDSVFNDVRPTIPRSKIGQVTLDNLSTNAQCRYSHNPEYDISWFKAGEYIDFATPQERTIDGTKVRLGAATQTKLTPVNEEGLGRVSKLTTTKTNGAAYLDLYIDIPPSMRGSQVIIGARVKVVSSQVIPVGTELFNNGLVFNNIGSNETGAYKKIVRSNNRMVALNTWQDMYVVLGEVQGNFGVQLFAFVGLSGVDFTDVEVHIADFKVSIGQELPNLAVANNEPVTLRAPTMPVEGYYMQGDIVYNTGTEDVTGWRRKTTGMGNTLGTDWIAFGEAVTEEIPTLTSGPTAQRPTGVEVGFNYFDTTLAIPIYYKAVGEWVNSTGEVV